MRPNQNIGLVFLVTSLSWLGSVGCDNKPAEGKPKAAVEEVTQAPPPPPPAAPTPTATRYAFSQENSKIEFTGAKVTGKNNGSFKTFSGTIDLRDGNTAGSGIVHVEIDIASLEADIDKLTQHLKSPDLLDATKFPKASFNSTDIAAKEGSTYTITGYFQLHGQAKKISFPATIRATSDQVEADAEFAINRKDFGIVYPGKPDDLIQDDVLIKLTIRAPKKAA